MKCGITLTVIAVPCIKVALKILLFQSLPGSQFFILYHIQYYHNPIVWLHHLGEDRKCSTVDSFWAIFSICCGNHMLSYVVVFIMYLHHFQMVPMIQDSCTILAQTMKEVADSGKSADVWRYAHYIHHVQEEKGVVMCTCMNMYWQFCASHSKLFLQYAISEFMVVSSIYMYM